MNLDANYFKGEKNSGTQICGITLIVHRVLFSRNIIDSKPIKERIDVLRVKRGISMFV